MVQLVLASASKDRKLCFERAHIPVKIIPSDFDETSVPRQDPPVYVQTLAFHKANTVLQIWNEKYRNCGDSNHYSTEAIIIGADTMVVLDSKLIGKAHSIEEAHSILSKLVGNTHLLITGVCILSTFQEKQLSFVEHAKVHMHSLSSAEIWAYLKGTSEYQGRAGAYSLFERASLFIDHIEGSPTNVIGLPMAKIRESLLKFGIDLLSF
ncbi:Maf family protein [Candidatus Harpocratesius sp.]